jgi:hypothetical protein
LSLRDTAILAVPPATRGKQLRGRDSAFGNRKVEPQMDADKRRFLDNMNIGVYRRPSAANLSQLAAT